MKKKDYTLMNKVQLMSELLHISTSSFYRYKNIDRPELVSLLDNYFSAEDLRSWLQGSCIKQYDKNMLLTWFSYKLGKLLSNANDFMDEIEVFDFAYIVKTYMFEFIQATSYNNQYSLSYYIEFCLNSRLDSLIKENTKNKVVITKHKTIAIAATAMFDKFDFMFLIDYYRKL